MSQETELCAYSDDNEERPNTAPVPSHSLSRKRPRDKEESSNDIHPRNEKEPRYKTATGSAEFVIDLELADEVEVQPHRKRRGVMRSEQNDAVRKCAQILEGLHATEQDADSEDSEQTSRNDGSTNTNSQKLSTSKPPSNVSRRQRRASAWEDRLSELANYHKSHGNCNVPQRYSENSKLGNWVPTQRHQYKLHLEGKISQMAGPRIQELESLGFEWRVCVIAWEDRLSELADYCKQYGHCNVPYNHPELSNWVVGAQRSNYKLYQEGKTSSMSTFRIQELEGLGFEWGRVTAREYRLSELADYRTIHGHCNVPYNCSETYKLGQWVGTKRKQYKLHLEGKTSHMTTFRIQELESIGF
jgi:hypothetical protein